MYIAMMSMSWIEMIMMIVMCDENDDDINNDDKY
jgi:hypothetical protein